MARITSEIGSKEEALRTLEQASKLFQDLIRAHPDDAGFRSDLARTEATIGDLEQATGHTDQARRSYERARELQLRVGARPPGRHTVPGRAGRDAQQPRRPALRRRGAGRLIAQLRAGPRHPRGTRARPLRCPQVPQRVARVYNSLAFLQRDGGHPDRALQSYERARDLRNMLVHDYPTVTQFQADLAVTYSNLGNQQGALGHDDQALRSYTRARELQFTLVRANPAVSHYQRSLAETTVNLANLQSRTGHAQEAAGNYQRAREALRGARRGEPRCHRASGAIWLFRSATSPTCRPRRGVPRRP